MIFVAPWVLSGLLVATYAGAVFLLQSALGGVIQGQTVAVAGSTLLAAALFQPLRRRVQSLVDRRFDRGEVHGNRLCFPGELRSRRAFLDIHGECAGRRSARFSE